MMWCYFTSLNEGHTSCHCGPTQTCHNLNSGQSWWFPFLTIIPVRENSEVVIIYPAYSHIYVISDYISHIVCIYIYNIHIYTHQSKCIYIYMFCKYICIIFTYVLYLHMYYIYICIIYTYVLYIYICITFIYLGLIYIYIIYVYIYIYLYSVLSMYYMSFKYQQYHISYIGHVTDDGAQLPDGFGGLASFRCGFVKPSVAHRLRP